MSARPWAAVAGGVALDVRLTPKGGRDAVGGIEQMADGRSVLKVRVAAPPREGEANDALLRLIAGQLGVAPRDVALAAGAASRVKRLMIAGEPAALIAKLQRLAASQ